MDCTVRNVIYVIKCRGCGKYYIGETTNLRNRVTLHNQHIRHENLRMIPVSGHLASCSNSDPKYFIYWAKVLPEQWELLKIFKKHDLFRNCLRMH